MIEIKTNKQKAELANKKMPKTYNLAFLKKTIQEKGKKVEIWTLKMPINKPFSKKLFASIINLVGGENANVIIT